MHQATKNEGIAMALCVAIASGVAIAVITDNAIATVFTVVVGLFVGFVAGATLEILKAD